jgi:hypothetical protein
LVNNFATKVRPAFDFLSAVNGYRLAHEEISSSFDNGVLIYESDHLRVAVVRDRGQVSFTVRGRGDYRDVDEEILRCLLADAKHYSKTEAVPDFTVASSAGFLRTNLPAIERLFTAASLEGTIHRAQALQAERADTLFGPLNSR